MSVIPCHSDLKVRKEKVAAYVEALKLTAHTIGNHGLNEEDFYESGFFRAAVESMRGANSATLGEKRDFAQRVLSILQEREFIRDWDAAGSQNRYDYDVTLRSGRRAAIELKGCLDGNNTNIFERPNHAKEFLIWSICANKFSDTGRNAWSGLHTRLSAEIILANKQVDGLIIWDWICGSRERPCPKLRTVTNKAPIQIGPYNLPPPCLYVFPDSVPSVRNNPCPQPARIQNLELLTAFQRCFGVDNNSINYVTFEVRQSGQETVRRTTVHRGEVIVKQSKFTPLRRS